MRTGDWTLQMNWRGFLSISVGRVGDDLEEAWCLFVVGHNQRCVNELLWLWLCAFLSKHLSAAVCWCHEIVVVHASAIVVGIGCSSPVVLFSAEGSRGGSRESRNRKLA